MIVRLFEDKNLLAKTAAEHAATAIRRAVGDIGQARIVVATGNSQLEFLDALSKSEGIDWQRVEMFHLDEYVGLPITHPASFRKYLLEKFIRKVGLTRYHLLDGDGYPREVTQRVGENLTSAPVDVAFAGIGENGHLAFNDPPANFDTEEPFIVVDLAERGRLQQVREGWFTSLDDVPRTAITMSIRQILKAHAILCLVSGAR